jgi:ribonuclease HI
MTSKTTAVLYIDGAAKGNPGPAGCGVVILFGGVSIFSGGFFLGKATNNVAEYQGLLRGLDEAAKLKIGSLEIRSDSELLVRQMNGQYKIKAPNLKPLWKRAKDAAAGFQSVSFMHVPREENNAADGLANKAVKAGRDVIDEL